ncbi:hypothetical protein EWI11_02860 [Enterococcus faecium]|uniref:Uncharacterized protein n=1 Tax=Enterococcus faecium TaxID=1352 RepID=A0A1M2WSK6_ENTFC|nr:hypothetical protein AL026_14700 [Enterococcus faecium]APV58098.1 hypothetical protein AL023_12805 [Enterococcus faecium]AQY29614.1 hypothetical protein B4W80_12105 [Enterococcus faecium]AQY31603.1 hypothetical protein B4W81_06220 [Enterococcus faecium]ATD79304.1 hypothetical protein CNX66_12295 [Enterococcus faecium]
MTKVLSQFFFTNKWRSRDRLSTIRHNFVKYGKLFFKIASYCSCGLLVAMFVRVFIIAQG